MKNILRKIWYWLCKYPLRLLPDTLFFNLETWITYCRFGEKFHWLNIQHPKRFNEKIHWLKMHPCAKNGAILADKYRVREYIANSIGEEYLVPLLGVWESADNIDFDLLPNQFALKVNHGSGMNIICTDKSKLNINQTRKKLTGWLKTNPYYISREWQYKDVPARIICEKFLEYDIMDYKFFCFNGEPKFVQVDIARFTNHTRVFFDMDWQVAPFTMLYKIPEQLPQVPKQFGEMKQLAKKLSQGIDFVRVDLYINNDKVYFGEITLHPEGGTGIFKSDEYDYVLGSMITLNHEE